MALFKWDTSMEVGIPVIDKEHQYLVKLLNDFYKNLQKQPSRGLLGDLLSELLTYTTYHHALEEQYMESRNYPGFQAHKQEHEAFARKIDAINVRYRLGRVVISYEITSLMQDWIENHIKVADKKYSKYCRHHALQ